MRNFNTNQTRHFYVAGALKTNAEPTNNLDIALKTAASGEFFFKYKNADGLLTRSDTIDPKKVVSLKLTTAAQMDVPIPIHVVTVDTDHYANVAALVGKTVKLIVTFHQIFDYDESNSITVTAEHTVASGESATNFYTALANELNKLMPKPDKLFPYATITGTANGLAIVPAPQKYVRGKLSGDPVTVSVAFGLADAAYSDDPQWGKDTVGADATAAAIPSGRAVADLEYFALGERGDVYRGSMWPNEYNTTYVIDPAEEYNIVSIEYYWNGDAENVQKSPRLIQIAAEAAESNDIATAIHTAVNTLVNGESASATPEQG